MRQLWIITACPRPCPCQHTAPGDSWLLLPLAGESHTRTHQFVLGRPAQASLFVDQSLNTFKKNHIPRQNTWNANPLYQLDLVPFPQRCTDLSHIHPQTWTCRKHTVDRFSAPCVSPSVRLLPDRLSFLIHSGFHKISVFYSSLIQRLRETSSQAQYREPSTYCMLLKPAHSDRFQGYS